MAYSACQQDLLPTILAWYDIDVPANVTGKSLLPLMTGVEKSDRGCYIEMSMLKDDKRSNIANRYRKHAFVDGRYKAIQSLSGANTVVYDLDNDALEQHPLNPNTHPGFWKTLKALYQHDLNRKAVLQSIPIPGRPIRLPDDVGQSLKNLGYVQ